MLGKVNLNLLRSLHVLLEECHVSKAADRLHITQSAVSRQLSHLRSLFGDPLLIREGNRLIPTSRALELQKKLNSLFEEFEHLLDEQTFEPADWKGEMVFSSSDYIAQYIFPELVIRTSKLAPNATFRYVMWEQALIDDLANSEIHLASTMMNNEPAGVSSLLLGEDKSVVVMDKNHPLAASPELKLQEMLEYAHIVITSGGDKNSHIEKSLSKAGETRKVGLKVPFFSAALNTLINSEYLLCIPEHIAMNVSALLPVVYRSFPLELEMHKYWLLWHPKFDRDPAHRWMREQATAALKNSMYSIGYESKS